ncbi:MAG TPA: hypothetical protein VGO90_06485 [Chthoniobacteraceae bacterium]|jgi:hypothetical protein|nr:hypothetical protein [Chthoniobacteraceae bacterium]
MIELTGDDDPQFLGLATKLLTAAIASSRPAEVYLIRIDQWFDAKWLQFSGKALGAVGVHSSVLTIPPFHPHRVMSEVRLCSSEEENWRPTPAAPLHIHQSSASNRDRTIARVSRSAIFFWYSSSTLRLDAGSTMLYHSIGEESSSWYAAFRRDPRWRLERHRGISPNVLNKLLGAPSAT